ncbi:MAG: DUF2147 domain-containing protein [Bacteroidetes bacterium]|nr:DUF2147 domain-containing protein [Bacteroidota bacterium]MBU1484141.1 DUF2147 domain-containing protein [Bacteroidota bacterium]MBU1761268.1 DUF2147 domain-containing protein [Bacteroidota bacterium]MBU2046776.1 DUF2147 domain-containing protein [Bacteroidota bacterium]MBU2267354.1 DUF2147 domain-containing protein [Bacteroidota bacterium]
MKKLLFLMGLIFLSISTFAQSADAVVGKWFNKDKEAQIQIYKKGNEFNGKIVWLKNPNNEDGKAKTDVKNPEDNLKTRPIWGLEILKGFKYNDGAWDDGTIYDPKSGKTYSCKLTLNGNDKLNVRGYIGIAIIGRTDNWTRVK